MKLSYFRCLVCYKCADYLLWFLKGVVQTRETSSRHTTSLSETGSCPTTILKSWTVSIPCHCRNLNRECSLWMWYRVWVTSQKGLSRKTYRRGVLWRFSRCWRASWGTLLPQVQPNTVEYLFDRFINQFRGRRSGAPPPESSASKINSDGGINCKCYE